MSAGRLSAFDPIGKVSKGPRHLTIDCSVRLLNCLAKGCAALLTDLIPITFNVNQSEPSVPTEGLKSLTTPGITSSTPRFDSSLSAGLL